MEVRKMRGGRRETETNKQRWIQSLRERLRLLDGFGLIPLEHQNLLHLPQ